MASPETIDQVAQLRKRLLEQKGQQGLGGTTPAPAQATNGSGVAVESDDVEGLEIEPSEVQMAWNPVRSLVEVVDVVDYQKDDRRSYKFTFRCVAGPNEGRYRNDWAPKQGGGLAKTYRIFEALGLRDSETGKVAFKKKSDAVGKRLWVNIVLKPEKWQKADGSYEVTERDEIGPFPQGYDRPDAYELPATNDPFSDGEPVAR